MKRTSAFDQSHSHNAGLQKSVAQECPLMFRYCAEQYHRCGLKLISMATQLPALKEVEQLSPRVIRILGGNPNKFTLQGWLVHNAMLADTDASKVLIRTCWVLGNHDFLSIQVKERRHGPTPYHLS